MWYKIIEELKKTKWWWYLPFISVFYIEQQFIWIDDGENASVKSTRLKVFAFIFLLQLYFSIIITVHSLKNLV